MLYNLVKKGVEEAEDGDVDLKQLLNKTDMTRKNYLLIYIAEEAKA